MSLHELLARLGIAAALGLLVGLQRERAGGHFAGIRTFALIALLGAVAALLSQTFGAWLLAAAWLGLAATVIAGNFLPARNGDQGGGITTEVAALVMFGVGAYTLIGSPAAAVVISGGVMILLQAKQPLHRFVAAMGETDLRSIMQFVLIAGVVLPILPNQAYDPYHVLNPFKIWLLVVLVVGMSLAGYVAYKLLGPRAGDLLGGVLGGLISSTATTLSYARRSRETPATSASAALVIMWASTVAYLRVLVLVAITAGAALGDIAWPLAAMAGFTVLVSLAMVLVIPTGHGPMPEPKNPTQLRPALVFAFLFAVILLAVAAGREYLGDRGLFVIAGLAGLTDMDAITLSTTQMAAKALVDGPTAWRLILVASLANFVFKFAIAAMAGSRRLLAPVGVVFGLSVLAGGALIVFWPDAAGRFTPWAG